MAVFGGRARRKEFWYFSLFDFIVPLIGAIVMLVFLCTDSQPGDNEYGSNPKGVELDAYLPPSTTA